MDEGFERTIPDGAAIASRVTNPDAFHMTTGAAIPMTRDAVENVAAVFPPSDASLADGANAKFVEAVYRIAVDHGLMESVAME